MATCNNIRKFLMKFVRSEALLEFRNEGEMILFEIWNFSCTGYHI